MTITFTVSGHPRPQGPKVHFGPGRVLDANREVLRPWRNAIAEAAREAKAGMPPFDYAVRVDAVFTLPRQSRARNWMTSDRSAYPHTYGTGSSDQLAAALLDSLVEARIVVDDSQVVQLAVMKVFTGDPRGLALPGVEVTVQPMPLYEPNPNQMKKEHALW